MKKVAQKDFDKAIKDINDKFTALARLLDVKIKEPDPLDHIFHSLWRTDYHYTAERKPMTHEDPSRLLTLGEVKLLVEPLIKRMGLEMVFQTATTSGPRYIVQKPKRKPAKKAEEEDE